MLRFPLNRPGSVRPSSEGSDADSRSRLDDLMRGAASAVALNHRLTLLNIEAKRRLAQYHAHFNRDQPRVPAGHPDGGQWTREAGAQGAIEPRVMSDIAPDDDWKPGARYANGSGR